MKCIYIFDAYVYSCGRTFENVAVPLGFNKVKEILKQFNEWHTDEQRNKYK